MKIGREEAIEALTWGMALVALALVLAVVVYLPGCTTFQADLPDGGRVRQYGAPLVGRKETLEVRHEWMGSDGVLHEVRISRNLDENADRQAELLQAALQAGITAGAKGVAP